MNVAGIETMHIGAAAEVTRGYGQLEVALVLDNTGSMSGSKLQSLKDSAHLMVKELFPDDAGEGVKVALIPFSQYVNVGMRRRHEPWMDVPKNQSNMETVCKRVQPNPTNCRQETCTSTRDGKPFTYSCEKCDGEWERQCQDKKVEYHWHGCVGSRDYPLNVEDTRLEMPYPGILRAKCASEIMPLTTDKRRIETEIDAMTATGETYIPGGLVWGWNAVSSAEPLSEGADESDEKVKKAVVLMTDGENTLSPTYPEHKGSDKALANTLSLELCSNIKKAKIKLFTVSFEVTDAATEEMLKSCASSPKDYYNADNPEHLKKAFDAIATALAELRISQ
jgi:Mg-chelatase subunit ChlD